MRLPPKFQTRPILCLGMPPRNKKKLPPAQADLARISLPMDAQLLDEAEGESVFDFSALVAEMDNYKVNLSSQTYGSLRVPLELLRGSDDRDNLLQIRPVHEGHKESLLASFKGGFMVHTSLLARMMPKQVTHEEHARIKEAYGEAFVAEGPSVFVFYIFDGNHRYHTAMELCRQKWPGWTPTSRMGVIPFMESTPDSLCLSYAKRINEIQHLARGASYVDNLTFVYAHVGKQMLAFQASPEFATLSARQKKDALTSLRMKSSDLLRANLTQTFNAAQSVVGLNSVEIGSAAEKFTNANVTHMLKMVTWLGPYGLKFLAAIQNTRWEKLAADRRHRLTQQNREESWVVKASAMSRDNVGWPTSTRVAGVLNRWVDAQSTAISFEDSDFARRSAVGLMFV